MKFCRFLPTFDHENSSLLIRKSLKPYIQRIYHLSLHELSLLIIIIGYALESRNGSHSKILRRNLMVRDRRNYILRALSHRALALLGGMI